jgi:hypothetical protein
MSDYYVLSQRNLRRDPAMGCLTEFEDVLLETCNGRIIAPGAQDIGGNSKALNLFKPSSQVEVPQPLTSSEQVLILVGMAWDICSLLPHIPNWRSRFDRVCVYVFDSFSFLPTSAPSFRSKLSPFWKAGHQLDHIFLPMSGGIEQYQQWFGVPVTMIPYGCDVVKFGDANVTERSIDVIGYGRQHAEHSRLFAKAYNNLKSQRMYYHTDHMDIPVIHDFYIHRAFFWKILHRSHIALAYDVLLTSPNRFPFSMVTQRWFECLTAGCAVLGRRPTCPEADQLLSWEDATIDVPENTADLLLFVEDFLNDKQRLEAIHHRNYINALAKHDWRYRIADMLDHLGLSYPEPLQKSLEELYTSVEKLCAV